MVHQVAPFSNRRGWLSYTVTLTTQSVLTQSLSVLCLSSLSPTQQPRQTRLQTEVCPLLSHLETLSLQEILLMACPVRWTSLGQFQYQVQRWNWRQHCRGVTTQLTVG